MTSDLRKLLHPISQAEYGTEYRAHYLEIYTLYVDSAHKISALRQAANSFFVTINTGIVGALSYFSEKSNVQNLLVIFAGVLICIVWHRLIASYRAINTGKFKVIHEMERNLPLAAFDAEWEALGRGHMPLRYFQFTKIEAYVPLIFGAVYLLLFYRNLPPDPFTALFEQPAAAVVPDGATLQ
jgi:hypothetical protein